MIIFACNKILMNPIMSFVAEKVVMDGLTFDDVLLIPAYSEVLPRNVELSTQYPIKYSISFGSHGYGNRGAIGYCYRS